jgi:hypothetical protein
MWKFRFVRDTYLNLTTQTLVDASHPACFECFEATLLNIAHSLTMVAWTCSLATHVVAMTLEVILRKSLGQDVCHLVFSANGEDLVQSISHVFTKVVVTHVDVLGARAQLGEPREF